jgi:cell division protein FtsW
MATVSYPQHRSDRSLLITVIGLVLFGLVMVYSSSIVIASLPPYSDDTYFVKRQAVSAIVGIVAMFALANTDYRLWKKWAGWLLGVTLLLLVSVFFFSNGEILGAHRWITLAGQTFQPSELAKLTFIAYTAAWLTSRQNSVGNIRETLLPFLGVLAVISALMLKEPDFGTLTIIVVPVLVVYFVAGMTWKQIGLLLGVGTIALVAIASTPYRRARVTTFLDPSAQDQSGSGYHINQISIAIGSGGAWGLGFGNSKQKRLFLPEPYTDSIYAITVEELGSVRSTLVIIAFCYLMYRGYRIASQSPDLFARLMAVGITTWFAFQTFMNLGSMLNLVPLVGVPLPFVSYGGSNLIISLMGVGVLLNISRYTQQTEPAKRRR